jgi:hypothetical protein
VRSLSGRVISGASIYVYKADSLGTAFASIYENRSGSTPATQPLTADSRGSYEFYVEPGYYDLVVSATGHTADTMLAVPVGIGPGYTDDYLTEKGGTLTGDKHHVSFPIGTEGTAGSEWAGGFYLDKGDTASFEVAATDTLGSPLGSYAAHVYFVLGEAPIDSVTLRLRGTTITDAGVRTATDTAYVYLTDADSTDAYFETSEKWLGQVVIEVTAGDPVVCNFGFAKYWDNCGTDFTLNGIDAAWLADKYDTSFDIKVHHHSSSGWKYNAAGATPPENWDMNTDHGTEENVFASQYGAWRRTGLDTSINADSSEGIVIQIVSGAVNAIQHGYVSLIYTQ